jgi:hypothetical protein
VNTLGPYLLGPNSENQGIYTGDARVLAPDIPDESVDLIFTDPVYQNIEDYRWLAETAARVLKPSGSCLAWCSNIDQYVVKPIMERVLVFEAPLTYTVVGKTYLLFSRRLFVWSTPCLWFSRGQPTNRAMPDTIISTNSTAGGYKWNKNPESISSWVNAFSANVVMDFFTGEATVPAVCKMLGRKWLAFEIVPETAEKARERVRTTQAPLFVPEPEQMKMVIA